MALNNPQVGEVWRWTSPDNEHWTDWEILDESGSLMWRIKRVGASDTSVHGLGLQRLYAKVHIRDLPQWSCVRTIAENRRRWR